MSGKPVKHWRIIEALNQPASTLGVLPELASVRPQLNLYVFESLPSTNRYAWSRVAQGAGAGTVIVAQQQQAGRGQWGRTWMSPPGGLYLSMVLEPDIAVSDRTVLTLASAWGIVTGLDNLGLPLQLKWPNDLMSQGQKVGGILTETRIGSRPRSPQASLAMRIQTAVVGVGLNWLNPVPANSQSLQALLPDPIPDSLNSLEGLAAIVIRGILQGYHYWQCHGTSRLIAAYQQKLANIGQTVTVEGHLGTVLGVSSTGDLVVSLNDTGKRSGQFVQSFQPGKIRLGYNV